jgi:hypothetical protein
MSIWSILFLLIFFILEKNIFLWVKLLIKIKSNHNTCILKKSFGWLKNKNKNISRFKTSFFLIGNEKEKYKGNEN